MCMENDTPPGTGSGSGTCSSNDQQSCYPPQCRWDSAYNMCMPNI